MVPIEDSVGYAPWQLLQRRLLERICGGCLLTPQRRVY